MLEIACFDKESVFVAEKFGADRIEFCTDRENGGLTPNIDDFVELKSKIKIPIFVMIRPKAGGFVYSDDDFELMKHQINDFRNLKADGFVFGILNKENKIDLEKNIELIKLAKDLPCTFHRAFDRLDNLEESLEQLIICGFKTVLTSGQKPNVDEGKDNIKRLIKLANGRIDILVGGGLRSNNLLEIKKHTEAKNFHSSALVNLDQITNGLEVSKLKELNQ